MRKLTKIAFAGLCLFAVACQKDPDPASLAPDLALAPSEDAPHYTEAEFAALLSERNDETAFAAKVELVAYALTRFLGEHGGLGGGADLAAGVPCDLGLIDDTELLRIIGGLGGMDAQGAKATLGRYIEGRIVDHDPRGAGAVQPAALLDNLTASLVHEGIRYDLRTKYSVAPASGNPPKIFLGHRADNTGGTVKAQGYEFNLSSGSVSREGRTVPAAISDGMLFLDAVPVEDFPGVEWINDPCHYAGGGGTGNGGSGNGGNGGDPDDDGSQRNGFAGGLVSPPSGAGQLNCAKPTGVRVTEMHLSRRAEGGWFAGNSEVWVDVTVYNSSDPADTWRTNDLSARAVQFTINNVSVSVREGKTLAEIPKLQCTPTARTVATPASGYNPGAGTDWVLLDEGFCDDAADIGYDRMYVTFFENDNRFLGVDAFLLNIPTALPIPFEGHHYTQMVALSDVFARVEIRPGDFVSVTNSLYIGGSGAFWYVSQTEPPVTDTWFRVELF